MLFYFSTPYLLEYTIQQTNFSWHTPLWAEIYYVAEKIIGHPPVNGSTQQTLFLSSGQLTNN